MLACVHVCVCVGRLRAGLETRMVNLFISAHFMSPAAGEMKGLPQYRCCVSVCVCVCLGVCESRLLMTFIQVKWRSLTNLLVVF